MLGLDGYALEKLLSSSRHAEVHRGVRERDGLRVVVKRYAEDGGKDAGSRAEHELELLRRIAGPGVARGLEIVSDGTGPGLVTEHVAGVPLSGWSEAGTCGAPAFLEIGLQMASILARIHDARILHRDIRPEHVLVDPTTLRVHLIGFRAARSFGAATHERKSAGSCSGFVGIPAYIAPEQTGRMGRGVDSRSDLYALGGTLYFMLGGSPPFEGSDPLALIHAHMARKPASLPERRCDLPAVVARIVAKLLEKDPDARYQTAGGLERDLAECRAYVEGTGRWPDEMALGRGDRRLRPVFSSQLCGRSAEIAQLCSAYRRASGGAKAVVRIAGPSGAGKSAIVGEVRRVLPQTGGYLATGKFDHYRRDVPYAGVFAALGNLVHQILTESEESVTRWRSELSEALGDILAGALVEQISDLEMLLGSVGSPPALGPVETQSRLALAVRRFVACCAQAKHPLVLFLDDLQWADPGSLALLEPLLSHRDVTHVLLVLAYRSDEVVPEHPLLELMQRVEQRALDCTVIELGPFGTDATAEMIAQALECSPLEARSLAECVIRKTVSNPLLIQQFVLHMHAEGLIHVSGTAGWVWDEAAIAAAPIPEGAVALMVAKLERLDAALRDVLVFASCVAHEFDVDLLAELSSRPRPELEPELYALVEEGLLEPSARGFRFVHDRVREAARALLTENERSRLHYQVGCHLLDAIPEIPQTQRIFEVAEHLHLGSAHVEEHLRIRVMELNLAAGQRALAAGAAATASDYFCAARRLLRDEDWTQQWPLAFELALQSAETELQAQRFSDALALLDSLEARPRSEIEAARVVCKRIQIYTVSRPAMETVEYALRELAKRGVRWPLEPSRLRTEIAVRMTRLRIRGCTTDDILAPSTHVDMARVARIIIIDQAGSAMAIANVRFATLASAYVMSDYVRHGYVAQPAFTIAAYGLFSYLTCWDASQSRRMCEIALEWTKRAPDPTWNARTAFMVHALTYPWFMPRRVAVAPVADLVPRLVELGDCEYAYYALQSWFSYLALAGDRVDVVTARLNEIRACAELQDGRYEAFGQLDRIQSCLSAANPDAVDLEALRTERETEVTERVEPEVRTLTLLVFCVYGRHDLAFAQTERDRSRVFRLGPWSHVADHTLYRGISAASLATGARGLARRRLVKILRRGIRRLLRFAGGGPDFEHMALLLQAERARLDRNVPRARRLYQRAAQRAGQQAFTHHVAMAHERHARMLLELRRETEAASVMEQAASAYARWGAAAKAAMLRAELPAARPAAAPDAWPPGRDRRKVRRSRAAPVARH